MKLTVFLMTVAILQVNANGFSQTITYSGREVPLVKIFSVIKEQAGFGFIYFDEQLKGAKKVTLNVKNATVEEVLTISMKDQPYDYSIKAKTIFIIDKKKKETINSATTNEKGDKRINISGKVTGEQGEPVIGATVTIKGTEVATSTNDRGEFFLNDIEENAILVVSNVSYQTKEISVKGRNSISVRLKVFVNDLDEAVVVAYSTTTQRKNTGSVSLVRGKDIEAMPYRSFERSLQGLVPGLYISGGGGLPGGKVSNIVLRGISTGANAGFGSSARNPLIVVDGVQIAQDLLQRGIDENSTPVSNPLALLNPADIESITVLKDASAISLYGTRASNGVILITTKKGTNGRMRTEFRHQTDIASRLKGKMEVLNQQDYLGMLYEGYKNANPSWTDARIKTDLINKFPTIVNSPGDTIFYSAPDWFSELFDDHAATISNDLSFSGGTDRNTYYLNFSYLTQNGVIKGTGFDRGSVRYNFTSRMAPWLNVGINSNLSYSKQEHTGYFTGAQDITALPYSVSPLNPVRLTDNNYYLLFRYGPGNPSLPASNPSASLDYNINEFVTYSVLSNAFAEVKLLKLFTLKSVVGANFLLSESKQKVDPRLTSVSDGVSTAGVGSIRQFDQRAINFVVTNTARYDQTFAANHTVNVLLGQEAQILNGRTLGGQGTKLNDPAYQDLSNVSVLGSFTGERRKENLISTFAQINYNFKSKYFASLSGRRDGSSKFGERERYGNYWSAGVGWVLTEEPFLKNANNWLSFLKIRGSIGSAGNSSAIGLSTRYDNLILAYIYNGAPAAASLATPGNLDIRWEKTFNSDAGIEAKFLKDRISVTADYYQRKTSNVIYDVFLPGASGFINMLDNIGDMRNSGWELSVSADVVRIKDFRWNIQANWSRNRNKLIKSTQPLLSGGGYLLNKEGENFNSFYLPVWMGVNPADGKPQWMDSTGKATSNYSLVKRELVGKPQPDAFGGFTTTFSYRNFELSVLFYYQYGAKVYDYMASSLLNDGAGPYANLPVQALDRWHKPDDVASNPRYVLNNVDGGNSASTRYLFDADYLRLKNVSLTYALPRSVFRNLKSGYMRVFVQGNNLALWTNFKGSDPDNIGAVGGTGFTYPLQRSFSIGLQATF